MHRTDVKAALVTKLKGSKTAMQQSVASASQPTLVKTVSNSHKYERPYRKDWFQVIALLKEQEETKDQLPVLYPEHCLFFILNIACSLS